MRRSTGSLVIAIASLAAATQASAQSASEPRGELLYSTHCIACHSSEIHWRDKKLATDWAGLKAQVRRWQSNTGLGWNEGDVVEVTHYLNELYYHFRQTEKEASQAKRILASFHKQGSQ